MVSQCLGDRGGCRNRQFDAIGDIEVGVAAGLLDRPDQVACTPLSFEFLGDGGVERDNAGMCAEAGARLIVGGHLLEAVLPWLEYPLTDGDHL